MSLVIPAYNEEQMLPELKARLTAFLKTLPCPVEVVIVNDGSADRTLELLMDWAEEDNRIKVLGLARNFGHQAAVTAGLDVAQGDAVVIIDADLQDPPEVIHEMLTKYREGYEVVYGQRAHRAGETLMKRFTAWAFYRMMKKFIYRDLPSDTGDFRLISRRCLDAVRSMRETHRFLRGMVAWVGFAQTAVLYQRAPRAAGDSKYPFRRMLKFAWTAAVSFSPVPLRIGLILGIVIASLGLGYGCFVVIAKQFDWFHPIPGWSSLVVLISMIGGAVLISNGILGEYVGRIFEESKARPIYIVGVTANLSAAHHSDATAFSEPAFPRTPIDPPPTDADKFTLTSENVR